MLEEAYSGHEAENLEQGKKPVVTKDIFPTVLVASIGQDLENASDCFSVDWTKRLGQSSDFLLCYDHTVCSKLYVFKIVFQRAECFQSVESLFL